MLLTLEVNDHLGEIEVGKGGSCSVLNVQERGFVHLGETGHKPEVSSVIFLAGVDDRVGVVVSVDDLVVGGIEEWLKEESHVALAWSLGGGALGFAVDTETGADAVLA